MSSPSHFSLLVVDDEPDLRTLYELTLLREGYDIETAGSVEEALLHLKDRTYSALITDMRLPDGTGLDLLRRLEETGIHVSAIIVNAVGRGSCARCRAEAATESRQIARLKKDIPRQPEMVIAPAEMPPPFAPAALGRWHRRWFEAR